MKPYDHKDIEGKWQKEWFESEASSGRPGIYQASDDPAKKKFYGLIEFPFPSGDGLHTGHMRSNTAMDIICRKRRMEGFNVLYPIGWDAFGLPTENYAVKMGIHPKIVTKNNTDRFREQLQAGGFSFDWSREVNTSDPDYYKWTQWIFLKLFEKGLAYKNIQPINWCPSCKIGLANEEAIGGVCERCGGPTEVREKDQWMLAITKYADRLDKDLDDVDYLEKIKIQQRNWIGKSEGAEITFSLTQGGAVTVFTTRPDTIFGATYVVLAPEHALVEKLLGQITNADEVLAYVQTAAKKEEIDRTDAGKEKTGVELKGVKAINPANSEEIPVYVADYVLANYGTGAVMAVPAHDERDFAFAQKYNLPIKQVIEPLYVQYTEPGSFKKDEPIVFRRGIIAIVKHWAEDKYICLKWKKVDWHTWVTGGIETGQTPETAAIAEIQEETGYLNPKFIKELGIVHGLFYHVPKQENRLVEGHIVYLELQDDKKETVSADEDEKHELMWLTKDELTKLLTAETHQYALKLLDNNVGAYVGGGKLVNSDQFDGQDSEEVKKKITDFVGGKWVTRFKLRDWVFSRQRYWGEPIPMVSCGQCGWVPVPEDQLPVVLPELADFKPTDDGQSPLAKATDWINTTCPKCGGAAKRETDTMPNWAGSSWYFLRYIDPKNNKEFASADKLKYWLPIDWYNGGMEHTTLHLLYSRFWHKFLFDIGVVPTSEPYQKRTSHGLILAEGGVKMSKSKGNVVNPDEIIKLYGADTLRVYEMFMGPFDQSVAWSTESIIGSRRFVERVWRLQEKVKEEADFTTRVGAPAERVKRSQNSLSLAINQTIKKVSDDIEAMGFNTAISSLMILVNEMEKADSFSKEDYEVLLKLVAPFAPHFTEELWRELGYNDSIHLAAWPVADESKLVSDVAKITVQVNSKVRAVVEAPRGLGEAEVLERVSSLDSVKKWLGDNPIKRVVFVPDKLINILI